MVKLLLCVVLTGAVWAQTPVVTPVAEPAKVPPASEAKPQDNKPAQPALPFFGSITGEKVRVRGGPSDAHPVLRELEKNTPVRVGARDGDWLRVDVPGGVLVHVARAAAGKNYVLESSVGEGVVEVDDLMVRAEPSTESPFVGKLNTGDRVVIIDTKGEFHRILAPACVRLYVYAAYVTPAADQAAAETAFMSAHRAAEANLLKEGEASRNLVQRENERKAAVASANKAFEAFENEAAKPVDVRDVKSVRSALVAARDGVSGGTVERDKAEQLLGQVDQWERTRAAIADAKLRLQEAERISAAGKEKYARDLAALRKAREEEEAKNRLGLGGGDCIDQGHLRASVPGLGAAGGGDWPHALWQGELRRSMLRSTRYDLAEYDGRLIAVYKGTVEQQESGRGVRRVDVTRLEVLH
jgi:uncharacterized protein YgiM (DUF1202 family)